ncbi:MSHA biogenesis protein MshA [Photobacterium damselae subsp. damselae]|uniref:type II secretion system protein n=1 Tax=Photobacterium damselae TaxID=38293 RepID=UPI000D0596AF|nr:type II secretion system protein [Photobacterium damselae]MCG3814888.1 type II secretion system protein [Photobacterium damselae]PSB77756.1 MSHA biogenesis protein MshA [Photobacterium damselae subsp. damselae]
MNRYKGFTLIELVVVIVILGILTVVAMPKFLNLQRDARIADLKGPEGALKSANGIVYGKAAIKGVAEQEANDWNNSNDSTLLIDGKTVSLHYGYILPTEWNIRTIMSMNKNDWSVLSTGTRYGPAYIIPKSAPGFQTQSISAVEQSKCYLSYYFYISGIVDGKPVNYKVPVYKLEIAGC